MVLTRSALPWWRFVQDRRGAVAAEFAMILPVLMLLFFGILRFGVALNANLTLTDGVRAAARQFAISRASATVFTDTMARFRSSTPTLVPGNVTVALSVNGTSCSSDATCKQALATAAGLPATMVAAYPCDLSFLGFDFAPGCTLSSQTTQRVE